MPWTQSDSLNQWIDQMAALCQPEQIHLCEGSDLEYDHIAAQMVRAGTLVPLNPKLRPHSFWCHSDPDDVARVEESTFICSLKKEDAGPTNNWAAPQAMKKKLLRLFQGSMQGRTMYIIPYC